MATAGSARLGGGGRETLSGALLAGGANAGGGRAQAVARRVRRADHAGGGGPGAGATGITSAIVDASKAEQLDQSLPAVDLTLYEPLRAACDEIWYQLPREHNKDVAFR